MGHHKRKHKKKKTHHCSSEEEWVEKKIRHRSVSDDKISLGKKIKSKPTFGSSSKESSTSSSNEDTITQHRKEKKVYTQKKSRLRSSSDDSSTSSDEDERKIQKNKFTPGKGNKQVLSVERSHSKLLSGKTSRDSNALLHSEENRFSKRTPKSSSGEEHGQLEDSFQENKSSTRDEWMNLPTSFSCSSNFDRKRERDQEKKLEREKQQYNPRECGRELNPYWKNGGDGLPSFKKPKEWNEDHKSYDNYKKQSLTSNWKKKKTVEQDLPNEKITVENTSSDNPQHTVTSQKELNSLAAKLVKAEIMGNTKLIDELKEKLEKARDVVKEANQTSRDEHVVLTHTDSQGRSQPLRLQAEYGESGSSKKNKKKRVETHEGGERVRYFPNDDKYSLKQMFENEKYNSVEDQNKEFLRMTSKVGKSDDLDDIFTDNIRNKESDSKVDSRNRDRAIHNHDSLTKSLDNCDKCIQSKMMLKHLMISMGESTYLALPAHVPLSNLHCMIVPIRHVPCSTQLDENEWSDILNLRKALMRLGKANNEVVIFFESAMKFHKFPHMFIECISLPKEEGDMAPIYFKKAIDESEHEWSQNKKLISLRGRDVRRAVPKGLPYFSVSFGMEEGFAHVIEDERYFPSNFAQEIIGGMLDLHHSKWRKPKKQNFEEQSKRVLKFSKEWKNFDCT